MGLFQNFNAALTLVLPVDKSTKLWRPCLTRCSHHFSLSNIQLQTRSQFTERHQGFSHTGCCAILAAWNRHMQPGLVCVQAMQRIWLQQGCAAFPHTMRKLTASVLIHVITCSTKRQPKSWFPSSSSSSSRWALYIRRWNVCVAAGVLSPARVPVARMLVLHPGFSGAFCRQRHTAGKCKQDGQN